MDKSLYDGNATDQTIDDGEDVENDLMVALEEEVAALDQDIEALVRQREQLVQRRKALVERRLERLGTRANPEERHSSRADRREYQL